jgi:hypothetical protein
MTEQEINLVKQLAANKAQFEAVKQFLLNPLEPQNWLTQLDSTQSDSWYGQQSKMRVEAKLQLVAGFEEMERLLEKKQEKKIINEAR